LSLPLCLFPSVCFPPSLLHLATYCMSVSSPLSLPLRLSSLSFNL
jgi:hypothetical protein